ncbi:hypothetical protein [Zhihengliuella salsuginis]|uniref:Uncharacterized protein n=1 Tax=Zhihengliuella salsuginis TaxID=578222 RepID=A0ABQ3GK15_9MICC|nr:hypothetical protein [Zhihengliuella salsuginis]GHD11754.1 hypothetical protein GCM10008096_26490 [Zhihengliuella salsuginis]
MNLRRYLGKSAGIVRRKLSPEQRKEIKRVLRRGAKTLPGPVQRRLKAALPIGRGVARSRGRSAARPADPLGLAVDARPANAVARSGRAAGAGGEDPDRAERLVSALRTAGPLRPTGRRRIAGVLGPDLSDALADAGYDVVPLAPGTAAATAGEASAEVLLIDLEGFTGLWAGGLTAAGTGLFSEVHAAIDRARSHGATVWVVARGAGRFTPGGTALRQDGRVDLIEGPQQAEHPTEDPGDAPRGILDIVRNIMGITV